MHAMLPPLALAAAAWSEVLVGGYTPNEPGHGIASISLNLETGELTAPKLLAEIANPSYLVEHPELSVVFAVQEFSGGRISAFRRGEDGSLTKIGDTDFEGGEPCHISIDDTGRVLMAAAYGGGSVASFRISPEGGLTQVSRYAFEGSGPNKNRQEGPHAHYIAAHPLGRIAYAIDLGTDSIHTFEFSSQSGQLIKHWAIQAAPGAGPRHMVISKDGGSVYVANELNSTVTRYECNERSGWLEARQTLSTLPEGADGSRNTTAAIHLAPNGRHLYVSNRGHDSLAIYAVDSKGELTYKDSIKLGLRTPRSFAIHPSGEWLLAAGQGSNEVASYRLNPVTGLFTATGHKVAFPRPTKLLFMR
jgi:6-phosphogluconolactonase